MNDGQEQIHSATADVTINRVNDADMAEVKAVA